MACAQKLIETRSVGLFGEEEREEEETGRFLKGF
jgi:hypothetical protein